MNLNLRCLEILQMTKMTSILSTRIIKVLSNTGFSKPTGCQIMTIEKPNSILEARYCEELVGKICNFFTPMSCFPHIHSYKYLTPLYTTWVYLTQNVF